jgi:hypothetical protein
MFAKYVSEIFFELYLEVVSKPKIRSKGKARVDEKAQHTWEYVSILKRLATQHSEHFELHK